MILQVSAHLNITITPLSRKLNTSQITELPRDGTGILIPNLVGLPLHTEVQLNSQSCFGQSD